MNMYYLIFFKNYAFCRKKKEQDDIVKDEGRQGEQLRILLWKKEHSACLLRAGLEAIPGMQVWQDSLVKYVLFVLFMFFFSL